MKHRWQTTETGCLRRLWSLLLWSYLKTDWTQFWVKWSRGPCSGCIRWPPVIPSNLTDSVIRVQMKKLQNTGLSCNLERYQKMDSQDKLSCCKMVGYIWSMKMQMCENRKELIYSEKLAEDTNCGEEGR